MMKVWLARALCLVLGHVLVLDRETTGVECARCDFSAPRKPVR
jgi:hypothetical protein